MYFYLHKFEENRVMVVHTKLCDVADCFYGFRYIDMRKCVRECTNRVQCTFSFIRNMSPTVSWC